MLKYGFGTGNFIFLFMNFRRNESAECHSSRCPPSEGEMENGRGAIEIESMRCARSGKKATMATHMRHAASQSPGLWLPLQLRVFFNCLLRFRPPDPIPQYGQPLRSGYECQQQANKDQQLNFIRFQCERGSRELANKN